MSTGVNNGATDGDKSREEEAGIWPGRVETRSLEILCLNVPLDIQIKTKKEVREHLINEFEAQGRVMTREIYVLVISSLSVSYGTWVKIRVEVSGRALNARNKIISGKGESFKD